jgi:hypothetical protein
MRVLKIDDLPTGARADTTLSHITVTVTGATSKH